MIRLYVFMFRVLERDSLDKQNKRKSKIVSQTFTIGELFINKLYKTISLIFVSLFYRSELAPIPFKRSNKRKEKIFRLYQRQVV